MKAGIYIVLGIVSACLGVGGLLFFLYRAAPELKDFIMTLESIVIAIGLMATFAFCIFSYWLFKKAYYQIKFGNTDGRVLEVDE